MKNLTWTIGDVEVHQIVEIEAGALIQSIIRNATPENVRAIRWLSPHFADDTGRLKALVQGFLIRSDGKFILLDTCNGNDKVRTDVPEWAHLHTEFLSQLGAAGASGPDIEIVACTHLHMDHVGWNTNLVGGKWVPTFPNAQYLFARSEYEYWRQKPAKEIADDKAAFDDSVSPIVQAGLAVLVDVNHTIDRHLTFIPTPGHTPAHVSLLIESRNKRAIISGDVLHHPCQIAYPEWTTDADTSPDRAANTRKKLLADLATTDTLLIGSHFAEPVAGRIVRENKRLAFRV